MRDAFLIFLAGTFFLPGSLAASFAAPDTLRPIEAVDSRLTRAGLEERLGDDALPETNFRVPPASGLVLSLYHRAYKKQTSTCAIWGFDPTHPSEAIWLTIDPKVTHQRVMTHKVLVGLSLPETVLAFRNEVWWQIAEEIRQAGGSDTSQGRKVLLGLKQDLDKREEKRKRMGREKGWLVLERQQAEQFLFIDVHDPNPSRWRLFASATVLEIRSSQRSARILFGAYPDVRVDKDWIAANKAQSDGLTLSAPPGLTPLSRLSSSGLEEQKVAAYRHGAERIRVAMEQFGVRTTLTPGEVWTLSKIVGPDGRVEIIPMDQQMDRHIPVDNAAYSDRKTGNVRYRLVISSWLYARAQALGRKVAFLFGKPVVDHREFKKLHGGEQPYPLRPYLPPAVSLDTPFLIQGEDPEVPRWLPAQQKVSIRQALEAGAAGYKTSVMLGISLPNHSYHARWGRLLQQNLHWVQGIANQIQEDTGGLGFGYLAGALIYAAPPRDYVPSLEDLCGKKFESLRALLKEGEKDLKVFQTELAAELADPEPADWAIKVQMQGWQDSSMKRALEASEEFAQAHQQMTYRLVEEWNKTPGITLIMAAGPYFVSTEKQWTNRRERAIAAMEGLRSFGPTKLVLLSRDQPAAVYAGKLEEAISGKLVVGAALGRTIVRPLMQHTQFYPISDGIQFPKQMKIAADRLEQNLRLLERGTASVWETYGITPEQVSGLLSAGLEEGAIGRLLIVEDDQQISDALKRIAEEWNPGIRVVVATNLRTAGSAFARLGPFDAMVTDIGLADGDRGWDLIQERGESIPTAVFSAGLDSQIGRLEKLKRQKMLVAYDQKPFALENLRDPFRKLLNVLNQEVIRRTGTGLEEQETVLKGHAGSVSGVAFGPDGKMLASAGYDGTIRLWNVETGNVQATLEGHGRDVVTQDKIASEEMHLETPPVVTPSGKTIFFAEGQMIPSPLPDGTVLRQGDRIPKGALLSKGGTRYPRSILRQVTSVAFSGDGKQLVSGGEDGKVIVWDAAAGQIQAVLEDRPTKISSVAISPDGKTIVSGSSDGKVRLWNMADPSGSKPRSVLEGHRSAVSAVAISPDGTGIATGSGGVDSSIRLWNPETGDSKVLQGHSNNVTSLTFTPNGKLLVSAGRDNTIRLWNVETGKERSRRPTKDWVVSLAVSPDSRMLAAGTIDRRIELWDLVTGEKRPQDPEGHTAQVMSVAFSPDGQQLASASEDGTIRLRPVHPAVPTQPAAGLEERRLSLREQADWNRLEKLLGGYEFVAQKATQGTSEDVGQQASLPTFGEILWGAVLNRNAQQVSEGLLRVQRGLGTASEWGYWEKWMPALNKPIWEALQIVRELQKKRPIHRLDAEELLRSYGAQIQQFQTAQREILQGLLKQENIRLWDISLPEVLPLYAQGTELFEAAVKDLQQPPGVRFEVEMLPPRMWNDDFGMILGNPGLTEKLYNPRTLPVFQIRPSEVKILNPALLINGIFRSRLGIPASAELTGLVFPDDSGRFHLILIAA